MNVNRRHSIWQYIKDHGPTSSAELRKRFCITRSTLNEMMKRMGDSVRITGEIDQAYVYVATSTPPPMKRTAESRSIAVNAILDHLQQPGTTRTVAKALGVKLSRAESIFRELRDGGWITVVGGNQKVGFRYINSKFKDTVVIEEAPPKKKVKPRDEGYGAGTIALEQFWGRAA